MRTVIHRLMNAALLLLLWQTTTHACIDSVRLNVQPVQCATLRNGSVEVDTVYGGVRPYYFSIDGVTYSTNPKFERLKGGIYTLYIRDASNCVETKDVGVLEPEPFQIKLIASDSSVVTGDMVVLRAIHAPETALIQQIEWRPAYLFAQQNVFKQTIQLNYTEGVAVIAVTKQGCTASAHLNLYTEPTNVYFPNIIKMGSNLDAWFTVYAGEGISKIKSLQVFTRAGSMIFERENFLPNDPQSGWNGAARGKYAQPGVYAWVAEILFWDGNVRHYSGAVTLVN